MNTIRYHQHQLIINYLFMKVNSKISNLHIDDLKNFLDEKGWKIYDINTMVKDIKVWQDEKKSVLA
jgi:hypothetical protein